MSPSVDGMPDILPAPSSDSKSNSLGSGPTYRQLPAKRNRIQLSCSQCRHAKLKCDRNDPCSQCTRKGRASQCSFPPPVTRKKPVVSLQNRLKHLESLVKGAMTGQIPDASVMFSADFSNGLEAQDSSKIQNEGYGRVPSAKTTKQSSGQVLQGANETTYVGATHWAAILDDVSVSNSLEILALISLRLRKSKAILPTTGEVLMSMKVLHQTHLSSSVLSLLLPEKSFWTPYLHAMLLIG
jgi:hypothetical protein